MYGSRRLLEMVANNILAVIFADLGRWRRYSRTADSGVCVHSVLSGWCCVVLGWRKGAPGSSERYCAHHCNVGAFGTLSESTALLLQTLTLVEALPLQSASSCLNELRDFRARVKI